MNLQKKTIKLLENNILLPGYSKVHHKFKLNGISYNIEALRNLAQEFFNGNETYKQLIGQFLLTWFDDNNYILLKSSGTTTGTPKTIKVSKQAMVNSAIATAVFFGLKPEDKALHCLPCNYIAGKMMIVRALVIGLELDLVNPSSKLDFNVDKPYNFCAMVPIQLQNTQHKIKNINTLIVGGAAINYELQNSLKNIRTKVYETFGMTETITHIAVRQINTNIKYFKTLPNVTISVDENNCLVINAPKVSNETIFTNDIVNLHSETEFEWIGRYDNIINSGGIKLSPEQIEKKLQVKISERFFIDSLPDENLGNRLILVVESKTKILNDELFNALNKYEIPKEVFYVEKFIETSSGKILRSKTLELIK